MLLRQREKGGSLAIEVIVWVDGNTVELPEIVEMIKLVCILISFNHDHIIT